MSSIDLSYCKNCTEGVLQTITMMSTAITTLRVRGCSWVNASGLEYLCHQHRKRSQVLPVGLEDVLKMMGINLRTNIKQKRKGKFSGKDQLYLHIKSKQIKLKTETKLRRNSSTKNALRELDISECDFTINDSTIEKITDAFRHLEVLKLSANPSLTNSCLAVIARDLVHLSTLDMSDCQHVSAPGLYTVAKHCRHLRHLHIHNVTCTQVVLKHIQGKGIVVAQAQPNTDKARRLEFNANKFQEEDSVIQLLPRGIGPSSPFLHRNQSRRT